MGALNITILQGSAPLLESPSFQQVLNLYNAVGWTAYTQGPADAQLLTAIRNSSFVLSAWLSNRLVGLARALSDDVSIFYLQDILVHPDFQRHGIGRLLLRRCLERYAHVRAKLLLTDDEPRQLAFYQSLGFKNTRQLTNLQLNTFVKIKGMELV